MILKCDILKSFKNLISNLEVINSFIKIFRSKGNSLPIKITIKTKIINDKLSLEYYLDDKINNFEFIRIFLFKAKNTYISQLNLLYKEKLNLRLLYGHQFRSIMKHLESNLKIDSLLRYIINNKDNNKQIKEGFKTIIRNTTDYINQYELYNKNSLESISKFITSVFDKNNLKLEDHFNNMEIKFKDLIRSNSVTSLIKKNNNNCKGIYLYECENNLVEIYIKFILG